MTSDIMDMDEDDDIYVPEEPQDEPSQQSVPVVAKAAAELEEGEEEDETGAMYEDDDDSDIDIITERKDGTKAAPPTQVKYSDIRNIPQRSGTQDSPGQSAPAAAVKAEASSATTTAAAATSASTTTTTAKTPHLAVPSADSAAEAASRSTVDINANPMYAPVGKPITQVNIDEDLPDNEKPWRKPGTDISDYFNYGFDEFTWALYAAKQESVRGEFGADAFAVNNKKMMEDFNSMMMMGGMGMGGAGNNGNANNGNAGNNGNNMNNNGGNAMPAMAGMDGMPAEMQQMMQQMMASGMDPSQMDVNQMSSMFASMQNGANAGGGAAQGGGYGMAQGGYGGYIPGGGGRGRRGRW